MNIFYLSDNPVECASYHVDKHVVKMILEYAQLLSSAHRILDQHVNENLYKITHKNHPSAIWTRSTKQNYQWLYNLFVAVCQEYTYRYDKIHLTQTKLLDILSHTPKNIYDGKFFQPPCAMPEECIISNDAIINYRNYYNKSKTDLHSWKRRSKPNWIIND